MTSGHHDELVTALTLYVCADLTVKLRGQIGVTKDELAEKVQRLETSVTQVLPKFFVHFG
jgi:hypothetical protein